MQLVCHQYIAGILASRCRGANGISPQPSWPPVKIKMQYPGLPSQHKAKGTPEQVVPVGRAAMAQAEQSLLARRRSERAAFY